VFSVELLSWHSSGRTEESHEKPLEIIVKYLPNTSEPRYHPFCD